MKILISTINWLKSLLFYDTPPTVAPATQGQHPRGEILEHIAAGYKRPFKLTLAERQQRLRVAQGKK